MKELNFAECHFVSGSIMVYVTEEWKLRDAQICGYLMSIVGGGMGLLVGSLPNDALSFTKWTPGAVMLGMLAGYALGYGFSSLMTFPLENDTWYDSRLI